MEIPIDYHLLFLAMSFILFLITMFLLFLDDVTVEKGVAALVFCMFNVILCIIIGYSFAAIDLYGYDSTGAVVHNVYSDLYPLMYVYVAMGYINIMLMFYCVYIFIKKPWEEAIGDEKKKDYYY